MFACSRYYDLWITPSPTVSLPWGFPRNLESQANCQPCLIDNVQHTHDTSSANASMKQELSVVSTPDEMVKDTFLDKTLPYNIQDTLLNSRSKINLSSN
ncbi:hypothetical protein FRC03_005039 [Tulasnella sp. 419]|nr:hypothetical protein FRC03_005039 [Tulasnella sp. 419]